MTTLAQGQLVLIAPSPACCRILQQMGLSDVLLAVPKLEERLSAAGITAEQIDSALEPGGYLGATDAFITAALEAHRSWEVSSG